MGHSFALSLIAPRATAPSRTDACSIEIAPDFAAVVARWRALRAEGAALAFQGENWLSAWYEELSRDGEIEPLPVTVVDCRGLDVLALPLVRRRVGALTCIEFADLGLTDYNAPIIGAGGARVDPANLLGALRAELPGADILRLTKMPASVGGVKNPLAAMAGARRSRLNGNILRVPAIWDDWHHGLERTFRKELERSWRVFERRDGVFRRVVDPADARRVFADLKRLQRARIDDLGLDYALDEPRNEAFYDSLVDGGLMSGAIALTTLEARGETVAALLGIAADDHYSMVRLAAAGGEWKNCSPGRLMIERTMNALHADGFRTFDFTIGDYAYKRRLGAIAEPLHDVEAALSWRGAPMVAASRARAAARGDARLANAVKWLRGATKRV